MNASGAVLEGASAHQGRAGRGAAKARRFLVGPPRTGGVRWSTGSAHASRALRVLVTAGLLCGPVSLFLALNQPPALISTARDMRSSVPQPEEVAAVGEWAQAFVVTWLSTPAGGEDSLRYYLPDTSAVTLPQVAQVVSNPAVADLTPESTSPSASTQETAAGATLNSSSRPPTAGVDRTGETPAGPAATAPNPTATGASSGARVWQVTIGVDVQEPAPQGSVVVRRYFAVPVVYIPAQQTRPAELRSLSLPGPVSAPAVGEGPQSRYQDGLPLTGAVGASVQAFLSAYLTDQGDVTRLLSPQAVGISAVRPVAYTQAQLRVLRADRRDVEKGEPTDGERVEVLATAILTGLDTQTRSAQFALTLTARAGRWEISQIQSAPQGSTSTSTSAEGQAALPSATPTAGAGEPSGAGTRPGGE